MENRSSNHSRLFPLFSHQAGISLQYTELRASLLSYIAERGANGLNDLLSVAMASLQKA